MEENRTNMEPEAEYCGTARFDRIVFFNPVNKYTVASYKTSDQLVPERARSAYRYRDHLIRFTAVGYDLPQTDAVEVVLEGQWKEGKYGLQLSVEQWREIVPRTTDGIRGYLASGLLKGIGEKTAAAIVERFGLETLDILEERPERLLEIKGITEERLADIKTSYAESRMLRDLMTLLSPYKVTPATAQKIYQHFGIGCLDILQKSPFRLCEISGFGFKRVDAIVQKLGGRLDDPMRIQGALRYTLQDAKDKSGHLFMEQEDLLVQAHTLLNERVPLIQLRVPAEKVEEQYQAMVLHGDMVASKECVYLPQVFALEDETARKVAAILTERPPEEHIGFVLAQVKRKLGLRLSAKQELAVETAFRHNLSILTGGPGTGKTTVLKTILTVYQKLHAKGRILLAAPTGRASRRMAESTGFLNAKTLHSALRLGSEEMEEQLQQERQPLDADLIIVDETSMVDQWLAKQFFSRVSPGTKIVLVGDADQLPSVGAGSVFRELIDCGLIPVTVLDEIFRQAKDSRIAYNAKYINESRTDLLYGDDFIFVRCKSQDEAAALIEKTYLREIGQTGIEQVQILSPFRSDGAASAGQLNEVIREQVNPGGNGVQELKIGNRVFRVNDRVMQTKNKAPVSNGDVGFIRSIEPQPSNGARFRIEFSDDRLVEYSAEEMGSIEFAYAATVHKAMGSEYDTIIMPVLKAHTILLNRNLVYTAVTRAKRKVILIGQKDVLFMAIHRQKINRRNTKLGERIGLYYRAFSKEHGIASRPPEWREAV